MNIKMRTYDVQAICTFTHLEWKIFQFICDSSLTKESFLTKVFNRLSREEILQLEKISIWQRCESDDEVFPFISDCRGKLYFQIEGEVHPDDLDNIRIRDEYINVSNINE